MPAITLLCPSLALLFWDILFTPQAALKASLPVAQPKESLSLHLSHREEHSPGAPYGITAYLAVQQGYSSTAEVVFSTLNMTARAEVSLLFLADG